MNYHIKKGWQLNSNKKVVNNIVNILEKNDGMCPCTHSNDNEDCHCPCNSYILQDKCYCNLYIKINE